MHTIGVKEISTKHFEHKVWLNELNFYADELKIYEHQLEELVGKGIREMLPKLEQFQNQFIRQKEVLDELRHDIKAHEHSLVVALKKDEELSYASHISHEDYRENVEVFKKIYSELKNEFLQFWKKWH